MNRIVIIGGSGFIGTHLMNALLRAGKSAVIFDKIPSSSYPELVNIGDIRDRDALDGFLSDTDTIIHLAAEHRDNVTPVSLYYDVNVEGAKNIIWAAERNGIKNIIFTSTVAVYGLNKPNPTENFPVAPFNDYGFSKLQAEEIFGQWASVNADRTLTIIRPVVIFGENNKGNVYNLIQQILRNRFIMVGKGNNKKSMGYVGNLVEFLIHTLDFRPGIHLFNYADKPDMATKELVKHIRTELNISDQLVKIPYFLGLIGGYSFDILARLTGKNFPVSSIRVRKFCADTTVSTAALNALRFNAPYSLQEGLAKMIANIKHKT